MIFFLFTSCGIAGENRYINEEAGFSLIGPKGWYQKPGGQGQMTRYTATLLEDFPVFSVIFEDLSSRKEEVSLLTFAQEMVSDFQNSYKVHMVEVPTEFGANGTQGIKFVLDIENVRRTTREAFLMRNFFYQFKKGKKIISILAMAESGSSEKYRGAVEEAVKSFRWLEK